MKSKKEFLVLGIVLLLVTFGLIKKNRDDKLLLNNPKYTIGVISSEWHSKGTFKPPGKDVKFYINYKDYTSTVSVSKDKYSVGDRFLILYDSLQPSRAIRFFGQFPIPDTIDTPKNGWKIDEIPFEINKNEIEHLLKE